MNENPEKDNLLNSALSVFIDDYVYQVNKSEYGEEMAFVTAMGQEGFVEPSWNGNYNIWVQEELVYEVEGELFDLIKAYSNKGKMQIVNFYEKISKMNPKYLKERSQAFITIMLYQLEKILLHPDIPIEKSLRVGTHEVFSSKSGDKFIINLN